MVKKILGYGLLVIAVFLVAMFFIPASFSPSASMEIEGDQFKVQRILSDIQRFRLWDPKAISDSTVSYNFSMKDGHQCLEVTDSLDRIMATYKVEESSLDEVKISVNLNNVNPLLYKFQLSPNGLKTKVTWSMDFDGKLMMWMFGVEEQLENTFENGLKSLNSLVNSN